MPIDPSATFSLSNFLNNYYLIIKYIFIIFFGLYFIFSLIIIRQTQLMTDTLITEVSPLLRAFSILHAGLILAIIVLFIGLF